MIRFKGSGDKAEFSWSARIALLMLIPSLLLNAGAIYLVDRDTKAMISWLRSPGPAPESVVGTLEREFDFRIASRLLVSAVLILFTMALLVLRRRHRSLQGTFEQFSLLALDIIESLTSGVIAVDCQQTITGINSAALRILRLDANPCGAPLSRISSAELPLTMLVGRTGGDGDSERVREYVVDRVGRRERIQAAAHVLRDSPGRKIGDLILLSDMTERYLLEQRIGRLERLNSLSLLASGLHHEIKNPLSALSIHVQLLGERLGDLGIEDQVAELLGVLKDEVHRLCGVLERFRDYAHLQRLAVEPADVPGLLHDLLRLIHPQASRQGVRVAIRPPASPLPRVPLDAEKFKEAALNLVLNALEAMPSGGDLILGADLRDRALEVEVSDTGPGIPPEIRGEVFKPYFSTKGRGTGLGLALAEKLVCQHQGQIDFRTGPGGTTFRITIPLAAQGADPP
jgi:two-component system, NtrC family, sensor histidine kinase HydH